MRPQCSQVLRLLRSHADTGLTQQDTIREVGCYRLAARISDLKAEGYEIRSVRVNDGEGHRFSRYWLVEQPLQLVVGL